MRISTQKKNDRWKKNVSTNKKGSFETLNSTFYAQ